MQRQLFILAVLAALIVPFAANAQRGAYGVEIRNATVNRDRSVTIAWALEGANVSNDSIVVDGATVRSASDGATTFTTRPLSGGWHTITINVREFFESYTPSDSSCLVSGGHYVCARNWRGSMRVNVPLEARCVLPRVVGLQLAEAKARITNARCTMGALERVHSKRQAGTVLAQHPTKGKRQLPDATAIRLVVSIGPR